MGICFSSTKVVYGSKLNATKINRNSITTMETSMMTTTTQRYQDSLVVSSTSMERQSKDNQNEEDMISDLSDDVLIHILSFLNTKKAVQTSILSKRWTNLWKTLPMLILSTRSFSTEESFQEFASQILSLRDDSTSIHTLCFHHTFNLKASLFQRIVKYAISHNVQHLLIDFSRHITEFPSFFFSCHTLTSLDLFGLGHTIFPNSLNSPSLTNLSLRNFAFRCNDDGFVDPFSTFKMLNTLLIAGCKVLGAQNLCISSTKLINLTIMYPQKESESSFGIELYAPSLHTFAFTGRYIQKLFGSKLVFSSIKHVNIDLLWPWESNLVENSPIILSWLVELVNIESLTVCSNTLRVLSLVLDISKVELPFLCNLKSLKIKRYIPSSIPEGMVNFLIQNSPSAKVDIKLL